MNFYNKVRAIMDGKKLYKVTKFDRIVFATDIIQCMRKFEKCGIEHPSLWESFLFLTIGKREIK